MTDFGDRPIKEVAESSAEVRLWIFGGDAMHDALRMRARRWAGSVASAGKVTVPAHPGMAATLSVMFNDARRTNDVEVNPCVGLRGRKGRRKDRSDNFLTETEVMELSAIAARVHGHYGRLVGAPMLLVAAWTGVRPGELFGLYPEDIELDRIDASGRSAPRLWVRRALTSRTREFAIPRTTTRGRSRSPRPRSRPCARLASMRSLRGSRSSVRGAAQGPLAARATTPPWRARGEPRLLRAAPFLRLRLRRSRLQPLRHRRVHGPPGRRRACHEHLHHDPP